MARSTATRSGTGGRKAASAKPSTDTLSGELLLDCYRQMLLVRRFEEKIGQMYGMGLIGGFCHLYIGQEAVVVGMEHSCRPDDAVITSYRCHAHSLIRGVPPEAVMAELTGRAGGISKGKGGSMHMFLVDKGFYGGHGIVGAQVPLGAGIAFAMKYREQDTVVLDYFGEGAANQGQVYEAFNMASLWKLPVVFVIENNQYAMGTSIDRAKAGPSNADRAAGYGMPGERVEDNDVDAVWEAAGRAVARARAGDGPSLIEVHTLRLWGHFEGDAQGYRPELEQVPEHDPIPPYEFRLVEAGVLDDAAIEQTKKLASERVEAAIAFAKASALPDPADARDHVFA